MKRVLNWCKRNELYVWSLLIFGWMFLIIANGCKNSENQEAIFPDFSGLHQISEGHRHAWDDFGEEQKDDLANMYYYVGQSSLGVVEGLGCLTQLEPVDGGFFGDCGTTITYGQHPLLGLIKYEVTGEIELSKNGELKANIFSIVDIDGYVYYDEMTLVSRKYEENEEE